MKKLLYILFLIPLLSFSQETITLVDADIKAFPTAEGYGKNATGGRGRSVFFVTNLNDSGAGSFRQAVDDADAANGGIVIFKTGGTITLTTNAIVAGNSGADNITIAGQTAPGDGIAIRMGSGPTYGGILEIRGSNTIARHLRLYGGNSVHSNMDGIRIHNQNLTTEDIQDVIVDHCSIYWTTDEAIEVGAYNESFISNITIQNTLIAQPLEEGYGPLMYRQIAFGSTVQNVTWYGNMFNDVKDRTPSGTVSGLDYEVVNNIKYNVKNNVLVQYGNEVDHIGNIFKWNANVQPDLPYQIHTFNYDANTFSEPSLNPNTGTVWEDDTIVIGDNSGTGNFYDADFTTYNNGSRIHGASGLTPMSSTLVSDYVTANVGANLVRDSNDTSIINDYINGTGSHVTTEGTHLTYSAGTGYTDTDSDGLSNDYETAQGGSTTSISANARPSTAVISNGDTVDQSGVTSYASQGYTHLDIFLADLANDWDSFASAPGGGPPAQGNESILKPHRVRFNNSTGAVYFGTTKIKG